MKKEELKQFANKLMFDMEDEKYETLSKEFEFILKEMDKINSFENLSEVEPMIHPFSVDVELRNDEPKELLTTEEALFNAKDKIGYEIKIPKVVGEE